jgi:hypothetical protein
MFVPRPDRTRLPAGGNCVEGWSRGVDRLPLVLVLAEFRSANRRRVTPSRVDRPRPPLRLRSRPAAVEGVVREEVRRRRSCRCLRTRRGLEQPPRRSQRRDRSRHVRLRVSAGDLRASRGGPALGPLGFMPLHARDYARAKAAANARAGLATKPGDRGREAEAVPSSRPTPTSRRASTAPTGREVRRRTRPARSGPTVTSRRSTRSTRSTRARARPSIAARSAH